MPHRHRVRSQGFSPSQRFNPPAGSRTYFIPHPPLGFHRPSEPCSSRPAVAPRRCACALLVLVPDPVWSPYETGSSRSRVGDSIWRSVIRPRKRLPPICRASADLAWASQAPAHSSELHRSIPERPSGMNHGFAHDSSGVAPSPIEPHVDQPHRLMTSPSEPCSGQAIRTPSSGFSGWWGRCSPDLPPLRGTQTVRRLSPPSARLTNRLPARCASRSVRTLSRKASYEVLLPSMRFLTFSLPHTTRALRCYPNSVRKRGWAPNRSCLRLAETGVGDEPREIGRAHV